MRVARVGSPGPVLWVAICLAAALTLPLRPAAAWTPPCGTTIFSDTTLDDDLTCVASAIVIGADGITLDFNGHTVTGSGAGDGVLVSGRSGITLKNGAIGNFESGVRILNSSDVTIKDMTLTANTDGVDCAAGCAFSTIRDSEFSGNRSRGVMLRGLSNENTVKDNRFIGNRVGVLLFGCTGCTVKDNIISDSLLAGVRFSVTATDNHVKDNSVSGSPAGIEFLITPTGSAIGNAITGNALSTNSCGLKGPLSGNAVKRNTFSGNVADACQ